MHKTVERAYARNGGEQATEENKRLLAEGGRYGKTPPNARTLTLTRSDEQNEGEQTQNLFFFYILYNEYFFLEVLLTTVRS